MSEDRGGVYLGATSIQRAAVSDNKRPGANLSEPPAGGSDDPRRIWLLAGIVLVTLVRGYFCGQDPVNSGDAVRHLLHSLHVLDGGLAAAGVPLQELDPDLAGSTWSAFPYNYPPVTLAFFVLVAALAPAITAVKVALTVIEALNAWLLARVTGNRWLGLLYWASPVSIWWVSGEGQFEPLQAAFMLGAILAVRKRPILAMALLGLGVQVKLTAVLLLPWLAVRIWKQHRDKAWIAAGAFAASFSPTLLAMLSYPVLDAITSTFGTLRYNPYFWNPWDPEIFRWNPGWLVGINAAATWAMLGALGWFGWKSEDRLAYLAPVLFLLLLKTSSLGQFWYVLLFPAFVAPIPDQAVRAWLVGVTPLMDVRSLIQLVSGPFGFVVGGR